jgi:hypothetical protein
MPLTYEKLSCLQYVDGMIMYIKINYLKLIQAVQKLTGKTHSNAFLQAHRGNSVDFTRNRTLTFPRLVSFMLNAINGSIQSELSRFFQVLDDLPVSLVTVSTAAFCKARKKRGNEGGLILLIFKNIFNLTKGINLMGPLSTVADTLYDENNPPLIKDHGWGVISNNHNIYGATSNYKTEIKGCSLNGRYTPLPFGGSTGTKKLAATISTQNVWRMVELIKNSADSETQVTTEEHFESSTSKLKTSRKLVEASVEGEANGVWASVKAKVSAELEETKTMQTSSTESSSRTLVFAIPADQYYCSWEQVQIITITYDKDSFEYMPNRYWTLDKVVKSEAIISGIFLDHCPMNEAPVPVT